MLCTTHSALAAGLAPKERDSTKLSFCQVTVTAKSQSLQHQHGKARGLWLGLANSLLVQQGSSPVTVIISTARGMCQSAVLLVGLIGWHSC